MPSETPNETDSEHPSDGLKGTVYITDDRCKGCSYCVVFCPTGCLAMGGRLNYKGYHLPELKRPDKCNGCDMCGLYCPDFAIFGVRFKKKKKKKKNKGKKS